MKPLRTFVLLITLAACGTPAGLEQATNKFTEAATAGEKALVDLDRALAIRLTQQRRTDAINGQRTDSDSGQVVPVVVFQKRLERVKTPTGIEEKEASLCLPNSIGCELYLQYGRDGPLLPVVVDSAVPNLLLIAQETRLYGEGLAAIAAADETAKVKAGFDRAITATCGLAGIVQPASAPACQAFAPPLSSLAAFVYGEYQERVKLAALREATATMNPVIDKAKDLFSSATEFATLADIVDLQKNVDTARRAWVRARPRTEANLESYLRAADALNQALVASRGEVFIELAESHERLTRTLARNGEGLPELIEQLTRVVEKAKKLEMIAKSFRDAAEKLQPARG